MKQSGATTYTERQSQLSRGKGKPPRFKPGDISGCYEIYGIVGYGKNGQNPVWSVKCLKCGALLTVYGTAFYDKHDRCRRCPRPSTHPLWKTWFRIITRCYNPSYKKYHCYGGRGITVCERWRNSFDAFASDMGPKPTPKHTIERKNNNGNYEPENCCWATMKEQANNRRNTHHWNVNGVCKSIANWAKECGFSKQRMYQRLKNETLLEIVSKYPKARLAAGLDTSTQPPTQAA